MSRSSQRIYCGSGNRSVVLTSHSNRTKICMGKSGRFVSQQRLNFLVLKITKLKGLRFVINSQYLDTILIHRVVRIQREKRIDLRIAISHLGTTRRAKRVEGENHRTTNSRTSRHAKGALPFSRGKRVGPRKRDGLFRPFLPSKK